VKDSKRREHDCNTVDKNVNTRKVLVYVIFVVFVNYVRYLQQITTRGDVTKI